MGGEKFTGRGRRVGWEERSSQVGGDGWGEAVRWEDSS